MKITHLQSSTQLIDLDGVRVLTDPWLVNGEYYGSWYHYPPFPEQDFEALEYDFIYVSHIHPDHLSEATFRRLPKKVPVLIHNYDSKFVRRKLEMLGFEVIECDHGVAFEFAGGGSITIFAADDCNPELCAKFIGCAVVEKKFGSTQIDTLAVFQKGDEIVLNTNDCPFELARDTIVANGLHQMDVDVLLVGYGGAGPYPQCFEFETEAERVQAAKDKERRFLEQAVQFIELIKPSAFVPFAGTYILGSRLSPLTPYRGVPSLDDAVGYLSDRTTGLSEGILLQQYDQLDVETRVKTTSTHHFPLSLEEYTRSISAAGLVFDEDDWDDEELPDLVVKACDRFNQKAREIGFQSQITLIIESPEVAYRLRVGEAPEFIRPGSSHSVPYVKISLDHNLLHRLLRGPRFAHWNNAEIGSHLAYARVPDVFERGLYHSLCFMHQ